MYAGRMTEQTKFLLESAHRESLVTFFWICSYISVYMWQLLPHVMLVSHTNRWISFTCVPSYSLLSNSERILKLWNTLCISKHILSMPPLDELLRPITSSGGPLSVTISSLFITKSVCLVSAAKRAYLVLLSLLKYIKYGRIKQVYWLYSSFLSTTSKNQKILLFISKPQLWKCFFFFFIRISFRNIKETSIFE